MQVVEWALLRLPAHFRPLRKAPANCKPAHLCTRSCPVPHRSYLLQVPIQRPLSAPQASHQNPSSDPSISMVKAVVLHELGGPENLRWEDVEVGAPGPGELRIRHTVIGLNYVDTYFRRGIYPVSTPRILGNEGVGVVTAVGEGVTGISLGDRVGYLSPQGSYSEERLLPAANAIPIPKEISDEIAAAVLLKGLTAETLLRRTFKVNSSHTILIHAAAGGVGSIVTQWAHHIGATVIGTVSNDEKAAQARADGADHVIVYTKENFVERVREITGGKGVHVVYDSVGKDTLVGSLDSLARLGTLVVFGQSSGLPDPINTQDLAKRGSLFLTRASLFDYLSDPEDRNSAAEELFKLVAEKTIQVHVGQTFPLRDVDKAHIALEGRQTKGSTLLIP